MRIIPGNRPAIPVTCSRPNLSVKRVRSGQNRCTMGYRTPRLGEIQPRASTFILMSRVVPRCDSDNESGDIIFSPVCYPARRNSPPGQIDRTRTTATTRQANGSSGRARLENVPGRSPLTIDQPIRSTFPIHTAVALAPGAVLGRGQWAIASANPMIRRADFSKLLGGPFGLVHREGRCPRGGPRTGIRKGLWRNIDKVIDGPVPHLKQSGNRKNHPKAALFGTHRS